MNATSVAKQAPITSWLQQIYTDPVIAELWHPGQLDGPIPDLANENIFSALNQPVFLSKLENTIISNKSFENFISRIRSALLMSKSDNALSAAIACYAFNTEYILEVTEDELSQLKSLHLDTNTASLFGCYSALYQLPEAQGIRQKLKDGVFAQLQMDEPLSLLKRRNEIQTITEIEDAVSSKVRDQYEESPYPRWRDTPSPKIDEQIRALLPASPNILVAGCGTGVETIQIALTFPQATILAIDLSRSSLAYATVQAERLGIKNITFRQADILKLEKISERFDYISSQGVLHHMKNPLEGWRILSELLNPQGLMSIGLYSEAGRQHIVAARKAIALNNLKATPDDIRLFRRRAYELLPLEIAKELEYQNDYYSMSMCRDMLFHVREHRFNIPQIRDVLNELKLEFIKFNNSFTPPAGKTLKDWHEHETKNPLIFRNMYKFWCKRN